MKVRNIVKYMLIIIIGIITTSCSKLSINNTAFQKDLASYLLKKECQSGGKIDIKTIKVIDVNHFNVKFSDGQSENSLHVALAPYNIINVTEKDKKFVIDKFKGHFLGEKVAFLDVTYHINHNPHKRREIGALYKNLSNVQRWEFCDDNDGVTWNTILKLANPQYINLKSLKILGLLFRMYSQQNNEKFPNSLEMVDEFFMKRATSGYLTSYTFYKRLCYIDPDTQETSLFLIRPNMGESSSIDCFIAATPKPWKNKRLVLFTDGHVEKMDELKFKNECKKQNCF